MVLIDKLAAIGDGFRSSRGTTQKYTLEDMAILAADKIEPSPITLTDKQQYTCTGVLASNYIMLYGNTVTTDKLTNTSYMFKDCLVENIPFALNYDSNTVVDISNTFSNCTKLKTLPVMTGAKVGNISGLFNNCYSLREIPSSFFNNWNYTAIKGSTSYAATQLFYGCKSLREIPTTLLKNFHPSTAYNKSYYTFAFYLCKSLDELSNLPLPYTMALWTGNAFNQAFGHNIRLKNVTFEKTSSGTSKVVKWKNQVIDLSNSIGWYNANVDIDTDTLDENTLNEWINNTELTLYNSGITADKVIYNNATYQALKNDYDAFVVGTQYYKEKNYSRYNHDSAVDTINSLPDTSAYLATAGGTNTIKFCSYAGSATDGGAISTLTAEEIAVATSKGWTVTLV